jgi:hypothetical protein
LKNGMASETNKKYDSAVKKYTAWALKNGLASFGLIQRPSQDDMVMFISDLATKGLSPGYIAGTLSGIADYFVQSGYSNPTKLPDGVTSLPILARCMRGIRRVHTSEKRPRHPLTTDLLRLVLLDLQRANPTMSDIDATAYKSALSAGVYGLLRISEPVADRTKACDPVRTTRGSDVHFYPTMESAEYYTYHIRTSKTDCFRRSTTIRVYATGTSDCPVAAMVKWWRCRSSDRSAPLYTFVDGTFMTRDRLTTVLRRTLEYLGHDGKNFASHSLRAGGAVSMAAAGYGAEFLSILGRWKSDAYLAYLATMPPAMHKSIHVAMARIDTSDITDERKQEYKNRFND